MKAAHDEGILKDLALLYVALAHGSDQRLENAELKVIADRLHAWQDRAAGETALGAIKAALEAYVGEASQARIEQAVAHLREACPEEQRRAMLEDFVAIALADDVFLYEEARFIERLATAWDVHPSAGDDGRLWSILEAGRTAGDWTPLHDLALVYLAVAHQPDRDIAEPEREAIAKKIKEWLPEAREADVSAVVREAFRVYAEAFDEATMARALASLKSAVPSHQCAALLADLRYIACADGVMLVEERALIERIARALGLAG
ncbi:tellurite resistance TerB family protein [Rhodocaloribacter sp.]